MSTFKSAIAICGLSQKEAAQADTLRGPLKPDQ